MSETERDAFLQAIIAEPDEVAPRLVFADWLDEHADPFGEFIRVSIELETLPATHPDWAARHARLRQLRYEHEESWFNPIRDLGACETVVRRGFVEEVAIDLECLLRRARDLFRLTPLRMLRVWHHPGPLTPIYLQQLAALPPLRRLRCLDLTGFRLPTGSSRRLAKSTKLKRLGCLRLAAAGLDDAAVAELREEFGSRLELVGRR